MGASERPGEGAQLKTLVVGEGTKDQRAVSSELHSESLENSKQKAGVLFSNLIWLISTVGFKQYMYLFFQLGPMLS